MIGECMRGSVPFGIVPIKSGSEAGPAAEIFPIGTLAHIVDFDRGEDGLLNIVVGGPRAL